jgi:hypothetical protein
VAGLSACILGEIAQSVERISVKRHRLERHAESYITIDIKASLDRAVARSSTTTVERVRGTLGDANAFLPSISLDAIGVTPYL